jgi:hypothetical protein
MHDKGKSIRVEEGLRLYQQARSPYWWAAIRITDPSDLLQHNKLEKRASTKIRVSDDPSGAQATIKSIKLAAKYTALADQGLMTKGEATFEQVAKKTIERLESRKPQKGVYSAYIAAINNYLVLILKRLPIQTAI